jgi:hypothetical protein
MRGELSRMETPARVSAEVVVVAALLRLFWRGAPNTVSTPNLHNVTDDDTAHYTSLLSFCLLICCHSLRIVAIVISNCQVRAFHAPHYRPANHRNALQIARNTSSPIYQRDSSHVWLHNHNVRLLSYQSLPSYPAKPEPLRPIFTFAQSQSCMNVRMDLDVLDCQEKGMAGERVALDLARPKDTYQSPLQRIGEALRTPRLELDTSFIALAPKPRSVSQSSADRDSPTRETPNYSYKLLPSGASSPTLSEADHHAALGLALDHQDSLDTGSIIGPHTTAQMQTHKGYFAGTSLLSSFFSNPRTRAPFKPQKTNRGTSSWQLKQYAEATLGSGSLRKAVRLPEGEDKDEWLAVNGSRYSGVR